MMTRDATTGIRLEDTPQSSARDEFMRLLDEHEDMLCALIAFGARDLRTETLVSQARSLESFRLTRRMVVAAYDQAALCAGRQEPA